MPYLRLLQIKVVLCLGILYLYDLLLNQEAPLLYMLIEVFTWMARKQFGLLFLLLVRELFFADFGSMLGGAALPNNT